MPLQLDGRDEFESISTWYIFLRVDSCACQSETQLVSGTGAMRLRLTRLKPETWAGTAIRGGKRVPGLDWPSQSSDNFCNSG